MLISKNYRNLFPIIVFSLIIFFVTLSDGIMSYITPVIIENHLNDPFKVGIILSISSFFGIIFDFFVSGKLSNKSYKFFIYWTIIIAAIFPTIFLIFPKVTITFIFAMIVWSIYYELRGYSKFNFVHNFTKKKDHTNAFSITNSFQWIAYLIAPLLAIYFVSKSENSPLIIAIMFIVVAGWIFLFFNRTFKKESQVHIDDFMEKKSFKKALQIYSILGNRLASLLVFNVALVLLDVTFWTMGILYAEELRKQNELGAFFITVYSLPSIVVGFIAPKTLNSRGKKKTAYLFGLLAAVFLALVGSFTNIYLILASVFFASLFAGIILILFDAVIEDYVARLKSTANDLISINQISINFSYAFGPIILGYVAKEYGFHASFIFSGIVLFFATFVALVFTPRKIKMPHKELEITMESK